MKKSLFKVIVIIAALLMVAGCPDPVKGQKPSSGNRPTGGASPSAAATVNYTVKHTKQDVSGDGYTEDADARQTLSGRAGASTAAQARSYAGFTAQPVSQTTIAANGSTVVTINYNRNVHSVSYSATTSGVTAPAAASYRFGAQVTVEFPIGISAWSYGGTTYTSTNNTFSMPDSDVVLSEIYTVSSNNVAETLQVLNANDEDTPYTLIVSNSEDLAAITAAISSSNIYVTLSLEDCEGLTSLPDNAFAGCENLTSIVIPETITSVGSDVFTGCTNLESVSFAGSVSSSCVADIIEVLPSGAVIEAADTDALTSVIQGINSASSSVSLSLENCDGLTTLDDNAFQGCENLASITLPDNLVTIGNNVFNGCTGLTNITLPDNLESIGDNVFEGCENLASITLPENLESMGDDAFKDCASLTNITLPDNLESIGNNAFNGCTGLESIVIPDSVTSVGTGVFNGCTNIESVTLPGTLNQTSIANVISSLPTNTTTTPYTVEVTGQPQISNIKTAINTSGKYVDLSLENCTGLTSLPSSAFEGCSALQSITIPSSVASIGSSVFFGCSALQSITIPSSVTSIGSSAFFGCSALQSITLPDSVTSIGNNAFRVCSALQNITLPDSVTSIGGGAFHYCSALQSITIPSSVASIGSSAFLGCSALQTITFQGTTSQWNSISKGGSWNSGCPATMQVVCTDGTVTP